MKIFDEIGSEYWKVDACGVETNALNEAVFTASGRSALSLIIKSANILNRRVLLPAYTCQHIVEPFAWSGWKLDFYNIKKDLSIELESLNAGIKKTPGCIIVQSYYGFYTTKPAIPIFDQAKAAGIKIIEDITHSFLSGWSPSYKGSDYQFCSLRKWTGLTDGGYALSSYNNTLEIPLNEMQRFVKIRHNAQIMKQKYVLKGNQKYKAECTKLFKQAEDLLDGDIGIYSMSNTARSAFKYIDFNSIKVKRRTNYLYLLQNIISKYIKPIFLELDDDTCPIMFTVYIEKERFKVRQILANNRIYCPIHWPSPNQLSPEIKASCHKIYGSIMSIPCDQRYEVKDMQRIVEIVNAISI